VWKCGHPAPRRRPPEPQVLAGETFGSPPDGLGIRSIVNPDKLQHISPAGDLRALLERRATAERVYSAGLRADTTP
jgi:hypothetical protein